MMRATVQAADLDRAMKHSVAQRNGTMPVLQQALLQAIGDELWITTSDLETTVVVTIPATVQAEGAVCAKAALLRAGSGVGKDLTLSEDTAQLVVSHGRSRVRVPALPAQEFPALDDERWTALPVTPSALHNALETVHYAAGRNDVRRWIPFVHLRAGVAESTDGYRVAVAPLDYTGPELLIPAPRVPTLLGVLMPGSTIEHVGQRLLRVTNGAVQVVVLLGIENYPNLESVVPRKPQPIATVSRAAVIRALDTVAPYADVDAQGKPLIRPFVRLRFAVEESAVESPRDDVVALDDVESVESEDVCKLPSAQLRQALEYAQGDDILCIQRAAKAILIRAPQANDAHVIMEVQ